jgi:hypothetical protein
LATITQKELDHLATLVDHQEAASDALKEAVDAMKEKYGLDGSTLKSFVKTRFGDGKSYQNTLNKHQQFVDLDEQFNSI